MDLEPQVWENASDKFRFLAPSLGFCELTLSFKITPIEGDVPPESEVELADLVGDDDDDSGDHFQAVKNAGPRRSARVTAAPEKIGPSDYGAKGVGTLAGGSSSRRVTAVPAKNGPSDSGAKGKQAIDQYAGEYDLSKPVSYCLT